MEYANYVQKSYDEMMKEEMEEYNTNNPWTSDDNSKFDFYAFVTNVSAAVGSHGNYEFSITLEQRAFEYDKYSNDLLNQQSVLGSIDL